MKSTGECLGIAKTFDEALYKAFQGAGVQSAEAQEHDYHGTAIPRSLKRPWTSPADSEAIRATGFSPRAAHCGVLQAAMVVKALARSDKLER